MLEASEMAELLGTCTRTIYLWHKNGTLRRHLYNNEGAYLYERPGPDSALEDANRRYRHDKSSSCTADPPIDTEISEF